MVRPFPLHASHGATLGLSFAIRSHAERDSQISGCGRRRCSGSRSRECPEEVETFHEEVPRGSNLFTVLSRQFHLWDSLHHDSVLLSDLLINGTHNSTLRKRATLETRTPNDKHAHSRRTAPQESGDNSPEQGGESNQRWPRNNTPRRPSTSRVHAQSHTQDHGF